MRPLGSSPTPWPPPLPARQVADFGQSHSLDATAALRINTYGTVTHMAPEVLLRGVSSKAADVFSFGVLLWALLTSSRPWAGLRHDAVVEAVAHQRQQLHFPQSTPPELAELAARCMCWEAGGRPGMAAVAAQLAEAAERYSAAAGGAEPEDF